MWHVCDEEKNVDIYSFMLYFFENFKKVFLQCQIMFSRQVHR